ncbi:sigma-70 family RNA polymerase sigma factor [Clostridium perfringens]|uniref:sigma-70 family RNA polymerase sigma factor n=1 Tax=Clostridium perfringens TaxID=1502 RepID=UPI0037B04D95
MINVEDYIGLAYKVASKFYSKYWDTSVDEINSAAFLGLVKARKRFNEDRGGNFGTFAKVTIEYEIKESIFRDRSKFIRKVTDGKERYERVYIDSLNIEIKSQKVDKGNELVDYLVGEFDMDKELDNLNLKIAINKLDENQRKVIKLIYFEGKTQKEVAKILGVYQQNISKIKNRAIDSLRKILVC